MNSNRIEIYSFYRFIKIKDKNSLKYKLNSLLKDLNIKGTILIADEGINGSISGNSYDLKIILNFLKKILKIRKISLKINFLDYHPFNKIKVRIKREIVSLGIKKLKMDLKRVGYIHPQNWDRFTNNDDIACIDTRNIYEIEIGSFKNSINLETKSFREFPKKFQKLKLNKDRVIAMYCTGGIRCEKASIYLKSKGYKNIFQLEGGILNYIEHKSKSKESSNWNGDCFVFDQRVAVDKKLAKGSYLQCYGCRSPITLKDTNSEKYIRGIQCHKCYNVRSKKQKERSRMRQSQIYLSKENKNN
tara:strand:- start:620 stop:1525 length:906 start_codon:yes stop_codon:yes gene_type:complete